MLMKLLFPHFVLSGFSFTNTAGEGDGISLTLQYHLHPFHRHLDNSPEITAESSLLHIASIRTRTRNLWFPSASR